MPVLQFRELTSVSMRESRWASMSGSLWGRMLGFQLAMLSSANALWETMSAWRAIFEIN